MRVGLANGVQGLAAQGLIEGLFGSHIGSELVFFGISTVSPPFDLSAASIQTAGLVVWWVQDLEVHL